MAKACLLGVDIGSSSVKVSLLDADSGAVLAFTQSPDTELPMISHQPGWAEQDPEMWWQHAVLAIRQALHRAQHPEVLSIGIAYQMHGLVVVDRNQQALRPAIIWCDSRAVAIGERAQQHLGKEFCDQHLLNSPGNFTASKLRWVRQYEPEIYEHVSKFMLPGDYIAMKLTGSVQTTITGLSEGIFWDYQRQQISSQVLQHFDIDNSLVPEVVPVFSNQGRLSNAAAEALGIAPGATVGYRSGDQPNNAFSLNVLQPGETAATAGTSGVIYAVTDQNVVDHQSRVNTFVHVNHQTSTVRNGVLLCINGTGIANRWLRQQVGSPSYEQMNHDAHAVSVGCDGLSFLPFGNGAERVLQNQMPGAGWWGLNFNIHQSAHLMRSVQEGIAFSLRYGLDVVREAQINPTIIRAGHANMFLSPLFREAFVNTVGVPLELMDTNGAQGAALGGAIGAGIFATSQEAFRNLKRISVTTPEAILYERYQQAYERWKQQLKSTLSNSTIH